MKEDIEMTFASHDEMVLLEDKLMRISYIFAKDAITGVENAEEAFLAMQNITDMLSEDLVHGSKLQLTTVKILLYMIDVIRDQNISGRNTKIPYTLPNVITAILNCL